MAYRRFVISSSSGDVVSAASFIVATAAALVLLFSLDLFEINLEEPNVSADFLQLTAPPSHSIEDSLQLPERGAPPRSAIIN